MDFKVVEQQNEFFGGSDYVLECTRDDGEIYVVYTFEDDKYPSIEEIDRAKSHAMITYPYLNYIVNRI